MDWLKDHSDHTGQEPVWYEYPIINASEANGILEEILEGFKQVYPDVAKDKIFGHVMAGLKLAGNKVSRMSDQVKDAVKIARKEQERKQRDRDFVEHVKILIGIGLDPDKARETTRQVFAKKYAVGETMPV